MSRQSSRKNKVYHDNMKAFSNTTDMKSAFKNEFFMDKTDKEIIMSKEPNAKQNRKFLITLAIMRNTNAKGQQLYTSAPKLKK